MVQNGIVLELLISSKGLEVDKAKIATIQTLIPLTTVQGVRSFLGHVSIEGSLRTFQKSQNRYVNCWKKKSDIQL